MGTGPWPADRRLMVRANFCNLPGDYTPGFPGLSVEDCRAALARQRDAGSTHLFFGPPLPNDGYAGAMPDFYAEPRKLRAFVELLLDTRSADGYGFVPCLFVGGDTWDGSRVTRWPEIAQALDGWHDKLIVIPAWEPVVGGWTSAQLSAGLTYLHLLFPQSVLAWHGSPTRWVGSSNPIEPDDPWQGAESDFYRKHGGEHIRLALYQTPHGRELYTPCTCPRAAEKFGHEDSCWLNRLEDGIGRLVAGHNGWRKMAGCLFETVAYEFFRGQATHADARRIASMAQTVAAKWGVSIGFGNGLPT